MAKPELKKEAVKLRKEGLSYREILDEVPVAKSTLSRWLRDVGLTKSQEQRLTEKKLKAAERGHKARRNNRIEKTKRIKKKARKEIASISKRDLQMLGIALYWAEGDKERIHNGRTNSAKVGFSNSDEKMVKVYLKWLQEVCGFSREEIYFRIFLHENKESEKEEVKEHWAKVTGFSVEKFDKISWKKHKPKTNRKDIDDNYYGLLVVRVRKSTDFNRKIAGWIEGIHKKV